MKNHISVVLAAVVLAAGFTAHPLAADKEQRQMMADIRQLQEQAQQLQNLIGALSAALDSTVKTLNTRLDAKIDAKVEEQSSATRKLCRGSEGDARHDHDRRRPNPREARDNSVRVGTLSEEIQRPAATGGAVERVRAAAGDLGDPGAAPLPLDGAPAVAGGGDSPSKLFDAAWGDYTSGLWRLSIEGFESYIRSFPNTERADDAQVNICNAYLNDKKYEEAIKACDVAIRTYPTGNKIPQAYYRKGLALLDLKRPDEARQAFEAVVRLYPNADEANLARQKLGEVTGPARKP